MAAETLSSVSSALSQLFDAELARQFNRLTVTAANVPVVAGRGKNAAWDVTFTGATAATVAEGSDVQSSEYAQDVNVPATLSWAHYRSSFKVSETELDAAATSAGSATALLDLFGERMSGSATKLAQQINQDMISATGTDGSGNSTIVGLLQGPLETTGTYATILRSSYSEWGGNTRKNGGTARPLSFDLLYQLEQDIYTASGEVPDLIICTPAIYRKYAGLFEQVRRLATDGRGPLSYDAGAAELFWKGIPVLRDRDLTAGTCMMLNRRNLELKYLPRLRTPQDAVMQEMMPLAGSNGQGMTTPLSLGGRVAILAKTGDSVAVSMKTTVQLTVKRPNSMGYIADISEV